MTTFSIRVGIAAPLAIILGACGATSEDGAADSRSYTHELGTVDIPAEPTRIVALDEYAAIAAYTLGVEPVHVYGSFGSQISATILAEVDVEVEGLDNFQPPSPEAVLTHEPDLVIATGGGELRELYDRISPAVPMALIPYYGSTWQESLRSSGQIFDRAEEANAIRDRLLDRIDGLRESAGDATTIVSVIGSTAGGLFAPANETPLSAILDSTGLERPDAQDASAQDQETQVLEVSAETLDDHDADVLLIPSGAYYNADAVRDTPTYPALQAVREGHALEIDGDMWFGNFAFAVDWILTDIEAIHSNPDQSNLGTSEDAIERWHAFTNRR